MNQCELADYLLSLTDWVTRIREAGLPLFLYGTGDGADKILDFLLSQGIHPQGVFASEGFVRNRDFRGYHVQSLREVEKEYGKIMALLCFGIEGKESFSLLDKISEKHAVLAPNAPVYGNTFYGKSFFLGQLEKVKKVWDWLSDPISKELYQRVVAWTITGDYTILNCPEETDEELPEYTAHSLWHVDVGAYDGDTAEEYLGKNNRCAGILAIEPDPDNFRKLKKNTAGLHVDCRNCACAESDGFLSFSSKHGRGGHLSSANDGDITVHKLDTLCGYPYISSPGIPVGSIKIDAEGMDKEVLAGAVNTIYVCRPVLKISSYHRIEDLIEIPIILKQMDYKTELYFRKKPYVPAWDTEFYSIPR